MAATHNVCGATVTQVWVNNPSAVVLGNFLLCQQCQNVVNVGEVTGTPAQDAITTAGGT